MSLLVSISCITYNHEDYIEDALNGFLMQKTDFKYEILIHDDASTDKTASIIREYSKKYPDIIKPIYQTENQYSKGISISATYNYPRAQGKYIAICEGDDYWTDEYKLQKQVDYMEKHSECSMCFHAANIVDVNKKSTGKFVRPSNEDKSYTADDIILGGGGIFPTASVVFPKKLILDLPEFYYKSPVGDYPLAMILSSKGYVYYIDDVMSAYRVGVKDSWTSRLSTGRDKIKRQKQYYYEWINMLREFNLYTNGKYKDLIDVLIVKREFEILVLEKKFNKLSKYPYKKYYDSLSHKEKSKIYIRGIFPKLYSNMANIKSFIEDGIRIFR